MKLVIDIDDEMVCNDIKNKVLEPTSATDEVIINALYNGIPYEERPKGEWRSVGFEKGYAFCICSECGNTTRLYRDSKNEFCCIADIRNKVIACLYCGADMRSVVDEGLHARAISDLSKAVDDAYKKARGDV